MTPYESIRLVAKALGSDESVRGVCPFCHGGRTKENSFITTRVRNIVKYVCHRATCQRSGSMSISGAPTPINKPKIKPKAKTFTWDTFPLDKESRGYLFEKYQFSADVINAFRIVQSSGRDIVVPFYNDMGVQQGYVVRLKHPKGKSKALKYPGKVCDGLAWCNSPPDYQLHSDLLNRSLSNIPYINDSLLIVEDVFSAIKASYFIPTVALLGASLSLEQAGKLAAKEYKHIYLALDADATARATNIKRNYNALLPNMYVMPLKKDLKDETYVVIQELINLQHRRILNYENT